MHHSVLLVNLEGIECSRLLPKSFLPPLQVASTLLSIYTFDIFVHEISAPTLPQQPGRMPLTYNKGKSVVIH